MCPHSKFSYKPEDRRSFSKIRGGRLSQLDQPVGPLGTRAKDTSPPPPKKKQVSIHHICTHGAYQNLLLCSVQADGSLNFA
jgi:hypothetical protein